MYREVIYSVIAEFWIEEKLIDLGKALDVPLNQQFIDSCLFIPTIDDNGVTSYPGSGNIYYLLNIKTKEFLIVDTYVYNDDQHGVLRLGGSICSKNFENIKKMIKVCFEPSYMYNIEDVEVFSKNHLRTLMSSNEIESLELVGFKSRGAKARVVIKESE